ncbi:hypothetical protein BCR34DRAFT_584494 [Clohesyomyces aquaticus]|uniref:Uncharacterized protein n=1 Tax=Clohesyomyces aquaticus TaxID=1231657 RepID=A0A1Y2A1B4_9PLEO|nr:hypothetical protein BCR34DRAFT_584494 [Clohesyomyces aquaticus]
MSSHLHPHDLYAKKWNPLFSEYRVIAKEGKSYVETIRESGVDVDSTSIGFWDYESRLDLEEARDFCIKASVESLLSRSAPDRRTIWLDERFYPVGTPRVIDNPLCAADFYTLSKERRFDHAKKPDAHRRLIYMFEPDPHSLRALIETASVQEIWALREAIAGYFAMRTRFGVTIPTRGLKTFRLEFHLPYFVLTPSTVPPRAPRDAGSPSREWTDLDFLEFPQPRGTLPEEEPFCRWGMQDAQFSLVLSGPDHFRWTAYAFANTGDNEDNPEGENECFSYEPGEVHSDPIVQDGSTDANKPIWDPREYFLFVVEKRTDRALREWTSLIDKLERSVKRYKFTHPLDSSEHSTSDNWVLKVIDLVLQLQDRLTETVEVCARFHTTDGDTCYFSGMEVEEARLSLGAIRQHFDQLSQLSQSLGRLEKKCNKYAKALQIRLNQANAQTTREVNRTTAAAYENALHNSTITEIALLSQTSCPSNAAYGHSQSVCSSHLFLGMRWFF